MIKHTRISNLSGGKGETSWIQPACSCEWIGTKHYAHNDYQFSNATDDFERHLKKDRIVSSLATCDYVGGGE